MEQPPRTRLILDSGILQFYSARFVVVKYSARGAVPTESVTWGTWGGEGEKRRRVKWLPADSPLDAGRRGGRVELVSECQGLSHAHRMATRSTAISTEMPRMRST